MTGIIYPRPYLADGSGRPLENGDVYIGEANQDPQTHPIQVYWDAAFTVPASQPLDVSTGYVMNAGSRADYFVEEGEFSIRLRDKNGVQVDYIPSVSAGLSGPGGASQIGAATGGTVEDGIWHHGRATPIAGSKMAIEWVRDDPTSPLENQAGIWTGPMLTSHGINKVFDAADGGANAPSQSLFVRAENAGSLGDIVAVTQISIATVDDATVFGGNILAASNGNDNVKLVGLEIDIEPSLTDTNVNNGSGGLFINVFSVPVPGPAIATGGIGAGTFNNGIVLGGLASTASGLSVGSGHQADNLLNTTSGTYNGTAITLGNGTSRGVYFPSTGQARLYGDGTNIRAVIPIGGGWAWRNGTDSSSLGSVKDTGSGGAFDVLGASAQFQVNGTKVVGARDTGWTAMTGSPDKSTAYATGSVTTAQLAGRVMFLQSVLTSHGLIGA